MVWYLHFLQEDLFANPNIGAFKRTVTSLSSHQSHYHYGPSGSGIEQDSPDGSFRLRWYPSTIPNNRVLHLQFFSLYSTSTIEFITPLPLRRTLLTVFMSLALSGGPFASCCLNVSVSATRFVRFFSYFFFRCQPSIFCSHLGILPPGIFTV